MSCVTSYNSVWGDACNLQGRYICLLVKKEAAKHRVEKITASDGILASYQSLSVIFARPPAVWAVRHLHSISRQVLLEYIIY